MEKTTEKQLQELKNQLDRIEKGLVVQKKFLSLDEASTYLNLSKSHIYKLTAKAKIPHFKQSKKLYFDRHQLDNWVLSHQVVSEDELQSEVMTQQFLNRK
jgi:excisionase family DNA binding protein